MVVMFAESDCRATSRRCTSTCACAAGSPTILLLSRWTSVSPKEGRKSLQQRREASRRSKRACNREREWEWDISMLVLALTKPAYTPRTPSQGLTVRSLLSRALRARPLKTTLCMHARLAGASSSGACSARPGRSPRRRRVGQQPGGRKGAPPRPSHQSERPRLQAMKLMP